MIFIKQTYKLIFCCTLLVLAACKERGPDPDLIRFFDQKAFLEYLGTGFIIPAYQDLTEKTAALDTAVNRLVREPNVDNLMTAKLALRAARISWQYCTPFELGPARLIHLAEKINTFPADTGRIEANMLSGNYNPTGPEDSYARGFPALDYLLNDRTLTNEEIVIKIDTRASVQGYLVQASANVAFAVNSVYEFWTQEGQNYYTIFTSDQALGVDEESSVAELVNALARNMELLITENKVGIPLGAEAGSIASPEATEAYHGGYSIRLVKSAIEAMQLLFEGRTRSGLEGPGLDEYLNIKSARVGETDELLEEALRSRFQFVNTVLASVQDPLAETIANNPAAVRQLHNQLLALSELYKADLAAALRVEIIE